MKMFEKKEQNNLPVLYFNGSNRFSIVRPILVFAWVRCRPHDFQSRVNRITTNTIITNKFLYHQINSARMCLDEIIVADACS